MDNFELTFHSSKKGNGLRTTHAFIDDKENEQLIVGRVEQYVEDVDNKAIGQYYALRDAIDKSAVGKDARRKIWNAFWNFSKNTKKVKDTEYRKRFVK